MRIGIPICEDIWTEWGDYEDVVECLAETGAELMIVPNGSPYSRDKDDVRLNLAVARVTESGVEREPDLHRVGEQVDEIGERALHGFLALGDSPRQGSAVAMAGAASMVSSSRSRRETRRTISPACSDCATT